MVGRGLKEDWENQGGYKEEDQYGHSEGQHQLPFGQGQPGGGGGRGGRQEEEVAQVGGGENEEMEGGVLEGGGFRKRSDSPRKILAALINLPQF